MSKHARAGALPTLADDLWLSIWSFLSIYKSAALRRVCKHWRLVMSTRPQPIGPEEVWLTDEGGMAERLPYYELQRPTNVRVWIVRGAWTKDALTRMAPRIQTCRLMCEDNTVATIDASLEAATLVQATVSTLRIGNKSTDCGRLYSMSRLPFPCLTQLNIHGDGINGWGVGCLARSTFAGRLERLSFGISSCFDAPSDEESSHAVIGELMTACRSLRYLSIGLNYVPYNLLKNVAKATKLEELWITSSRAYLAVDDDSLATLAPLVKLDKVVFGDCHDMTSRTCAELLAGKPSVEFREVR